MDVLIAGCGFTGYRVAQRFLSRGARVFATTRDRDKLRGLADLGVNVIRYSAGRDEEVPVPDGVLVLHSLPTTEAGDPTPSLLRSLGRAPSRIVYLSTTGVYGDAKVVDESTPVS